MNIMKDIKAFIFDLDGTLIDTEKIYRTVWPKAIKELGYELTDEMYLSLRSLGRPFVTQMFEKWYGPEFDYDLVRKIRKGYFDEYIAKEGIQVKKGAVELLSYLRENGIMTAIATATDILRANEYLKMTGLDGYFDRVISATMVAEGKPSPMVYEYACSELNLKPAECIAVEDAPNGVMSAYRAGMHVIMVPDLSEPDEELEKTLFLKADTLYHIKEYMIKEAVANG